MATLRVDSGHCNSYHPQLVTTVYDTDRSVSQSQEPGEDDPSNSNLSQESDQDDEACEAAIDLNACSKIAYYQDGDTHGVKYVKEKKAGHLLLGKGRSIKSPRA